MSEDFVIIDSAYRWAIVLLIAVVLLMVILPVAYRKGFPKRISIQQIIGGVILAGIGAVAAVIFREPVADALLLRARFSFMVPDSGVHGYGWFLVFGYGIVLANVVVLVVGVAMTRLGRLPPWVEKADRGKRPGI